MQVACIVIAAVILDQLAGEPVRWHPLVLFGRCANWIESILWQSSMTPVQGRVRGVLALVILVLIILLIFLPLMAISTYLPGAETLLSILIVYTCIASRSLKEHALAVAIPLEADNIDEARLALGCIVSRDVEQASAQDIASATCESVLENGSDGIFSALFWFVLAGLPGVLIYRVSNTLDAMWGYRNERYQYFGWAAAKLDDILNWAPARLVAMSYALMGRFGCAIRCWTDQARTWKSPNAGPVMASGAGSLSICLGGGAYYQGKLEQRPLLGEGEPATVKDIYRALALVDRSLLLWLVCIVIIVW